MSGKNTASAAYQLPAGGAPALGATLELPRDGAARRDLRQTSPSSTQVPRPRLGRGERRPARSAQGVFIENDFALNLSREKRRAERYGVPLSLVLYRVDGLDRDAPHPAERLLEVLHESMRETDILGHVGEGAIAVLCSDTDENGIRGFMNKVESQAGDVPFAAVAATYPDTLFDNLANGTRTQPELEPFFTNDRVGRSTGYPMKRTLDVVGAILAILLLWPVMLAVAAAVALTSRGPIVFRQTRVGQGGVPFTFYKFRSMAANNDDSIHRKYVASLIDGKDQASSTADAGATAAPFKIQADPRVTPVGRFIRRTSLDELPQFFNVLKGDMSLVGPRPPIPYEAAQYQPWHLRRVLSAKPGITGIWQVEGRSRVTFNEMVRMDLRYTRECSLALDLRILLKTVAVVFRRDGAW